MAKGKTEEPVWLTTRQVAERFQVAPLTVRRWRVERGLPASQVGRTLRFRADLVEEWFEREG